MNDDRVSLFEQYSEIVEDAISNCLSEREAFIIKGQMLSDKVITLRELGISLGISTERVRQIRNVSITKLSVYLNNAMSEVAKDTLFDYELPDRRLY